MERQVRVIHFRKPSELIEELRRLGVDQPGEKIMAPKGTFFTLKVRRVPLRAALLLKQGMLAKGGEAALPRDAAGLNINEVDVLLMGTLKQYRGLLARLRQQPFGLPQIGEKIGQALEGVDRRFNGLNCRGFQLPLGERTLIMGILNVTPDSFSDGGKFYSLEDALSQAIRMVEEGADIIDIGGESARPGATPISAEEEWSRVAPVIRELLRRVNVPLSIDTYKASVARAALEAGVHMVNDIWGLKADPEMASVVAEFNVPVCLMHNRKIPEYEDLISDMLDDLRESVDLARKAGVKDDNIILDPGIGFAKNLEENLEVMRRLQDFKSLGYPLLLGTSRKSMIGKTLDLPVDQRVEGTAATVAYGIAEGVEIIRVHDVQVMARVARMTDAMVRK